MFSARPQEPAWRSARPARPPTVPAGSTSRGHRPPVQTARGRRPADLAHGSARALPGSLPLCRHDCPLQPALLAALPQARPGSDLRWMRN